MSLKKKPISFFPFHLASSVAFALLLSSSAVLAHTTSSSENTPNWTSFYVGVGGGMGAWIADSQIEYQGVSMTTTQRHGGLGGFGTLIIGSNYQFKNAMVAGAFVDGDLANLEGHLLIPGFIGSVAENRSWALGARLGRLISPTILPYLLTGFSQAHFENANLSEPFPGQGLSGISTPATSPNGWFVGAGLEVKVKSNWSLRGEYRYADYGKSSLSMSGFPVPASISFYPKVQTFRAVVAYQFMI